MNLIKGILLGAGLSVLLAAPAAARQDRDALKKKILREVEEKLRLEEDRILEAIEKEIDRELSRILKERSDRPAPKAPPPREPGFLGVALIELTDEDWADFGVEEGIKVAQVIPGSPAEKSGLRPDDVITSIDGTVVKGFEQVRETVGKAGAGQTVRVVIVRGTEKKTLPVKLGARPGSGPPMAKAPPGGQEGPDALRERVKKFLEEKEETPAPRRSREPSIEPEDSWSINPDTFDQLRTMFENFGMDPGMLDQLLEEGDDGNYHLSPALLEMFETLNPGRFFGGDKPPFPSEPRAERPPARPMRPWIGIQPEELSPELRAQLDIPDGEGLLIYEVVPGSPAEKAGLKKHDILLKLDGTSVKSEATLATFMAGAKVGQKVPVVVLRKGRKQALKVTVGGRSEE